MIAITQIDNDKTQKKKKRYSIRNFLKKLLILKIKIIHTKNMVILDDYAKNFKQILIGTKFCEHYHRFYIHSLHTTYINIANGESLLGVSNAPLSIRHENCRRQLFFTTEFSESNTHLTHNIIHSVNTEWFTLLFL